jgi:hypothetical protein
MAALGTPEAAPDCECASGAAGIIAMRKGIMNFIGFSSLFGFAWF